jgi:hypothetical protein
MLQHLVMTPGRIAKKRRDELVAAGYRFVNVTSRAGDPSTFGGMGMSKLYLSSISQNCFLNHGVNREYLPTKKL